MHESVFLLLFGAFVLAIISRLIAGGLDDDRIRNYVRQHGGKIVEKTWTPFGQGWCGEERDRIYRVRYRDRKQNLREATVKTSMFGGVYFTNERIVGEKGASHNSILAPSPESDLRSENEQLRQRIAELEGRT